MAELRVHGIVEGVLRTVLPEELLLWVASLRGQGVSVKDAVSRLVNTAPSLRRTLVRSLTSELGAVLGPRPLFKAPVALTATQIQALSRAYSRALVTDLVSMQQVERSMVVETRKLLQDAIREVYQHMLSDYGDLTRLQRDRMLAMFQQFENILGKHYKGISDADARRLRDLAEVTATGAATQLRKVMARVGRAEVVAELSARLPPEQLAAVAAYHPIIEGLDLGEWWRRQGIQAVRSIRQQVSLGLMMGEAVPVIAQRVLLSGGGAARLMQRNAEALVRTAVNAVNTAGKMRVYAAMSDDVTDSYEYVATLDDRTTILCASLDGKVYKYGEGPTPPLHINCRSTILPVVNWDRIVGEEQAKRIAEEFPTTRATREGPIRYATYENWLRAQPPDVQDSILGPTRAGFFRSGDMGLEDFLRTDGTLKTLDELRAETAAEGATPIPAGEAPLGGEVLVTLPPSEVITHVGPITDVDAEGLGVLRPPPDYTQYGVNPDGTPQAFALDPDARRVFEGRFYDATTEDSAVQPAHLGGHTGDDLGREMEHVLDTYTPEQTTRLNQNVADGGITFYPTSHDLTLDMASRDPSVDPDHDQIGGVTTRKGGDYDNAYLHLTYGADLGDPLKEGATPDTTAQTFAHEFAHVYDWVPAHGILSYEQFEAEFWNRMGFGHLYSDQPFGARTLPPDAADLAQRRGHVALAFGSAFGGDNSAIRQQLVDLMINQGPEGVRQLFADGKGLWLRGYMISGTPAWFSASEKEIRAATLAAHSLGQPPPISYYAASEPAEAWGCFAGLVYTDPARAQAEFPLCYEVFKQVMGL